MLAWHSSVDNIFEIWEGTADLNEFLDKLTPNVNNLTFTMEYNPKISFLDVMVSVDESGDLTSNLFWKPTAGNTILRSNSVHPASLLISIQFSQYLCCICSKEQDFK